MFAYTGINCKCGATYWTWTSVKSFADSCVTTPPTPQMFGGGGRNRTYSDVSQQIYSLSRLSNFGAPPYNLVAPLGFEPRTLTASTWCSTSWARVPYSKLATLPYFNLQFVIRITPDYRGIFYPTNNYEAAFFIINDYAFNVQYFGQDTRTWTLSTYSQSMCASH